MTREDLGNPFCEKTIDPTDQAKVVGGSTDVGEEFVHESILSTLYYGRLIEETQVGPYPAVVPTITGSAYITLVQQFILDPRDPFPAGFYLGKKANYGC